MALVLLLAAIVGILVVGTRGAASAVAAQDSTLADSSSSLADAQYAEGVVDIVLGDTITVTGEGVTVDGTTVTIGAAGVYSVSGTLTDGQIVVNAKGKVYLEFNGVDVTSSSGPALYIADAKKVTLTLAEGTSNSLRDSEGDSDHDAALYTNDTLIINGKGSLAVTGNSREGIAGDDDIIINAGTLVITAVDDGVNAHDDITVTGGDLYVVARRRRSRLQRHHHHQRRHGRRHRERRSRRRRSRRYRRGHHHGRHGHRVGQQHRGSRRETPLRARST